MISAVDLTHGLDFYAGFDVINVPGATGWIDMADMLENLIRRLLGQRTAGGQFAADDRIQRHRAVGIRLHPMPPGDSRGHRGIGIRQRPHAGVMNCDVGEREPQIGKHFVDRGNQVFQLARRGNGGGGIAFKWFIGRADQRAVHERQNENRATVAGFGVDRAAGEQLLQHGVSCHEVASLGAAHQAL